MTAIWLQPVSEILLVFFHWLVVQGICGCDRFKSGSIRDVFRTIVRKDGYKGLVRGWAPRMLFHAPAAAICWSTYEASKTFFQELNGSSSNSGTITWRAFKDRRFSIALGIPLYNWEIRVCFTRRMSKQVYRNFSDLTGVYFL